MAPLTGIRLMFAFTMIIGFQARGMGQYTGEWLVDGSSWLDTNRCDPPPYSPCPSYLIKHHFIDGDSLHHSRTYKKVFVETLIYRPSHPGCPDTSYIPPKLEWLLRDSAGLIFGLRRPGQAYGDTIEALYFDHRGQVGQLLPDTGWWVQPAVVDSVDSIRVATDWRKRFYVTTTHLSPRNYVITEGIGWVDGSKGTLFSTPGVITYCSYSVPCFSIGDTTYYPEFRLGPCVTASLDQLWVPLSAVGPTPASSYAYPNPTNGPVSIPASEGDSAVELYTMRGDLLLTLARSSTSSLELDLSGYTDGTYIIRILRPNEVITERLVVIGAGR